MKSLIMTYYNIPSYKAIVENPELLKDGCWAYCDVRDIAQAFRLMVEAKGLKKHEVFCICAEDNVTKIDSVELVRKYWSERIPFKKEVKGRAPLMDYSKAKALLGYKPRYTWFCWTGISRYRRTRKSFFESGSNNNRRLSY